MNASSIKKALQAAGKRQQEALKVWYPQKGPNAPAERNWTLHLALALSGEGVQLYAEPTFKAESKTRLDLVAYSPKSKTLLVVEAKRFVDKGAGGLLADVERTRRFEFSTYEEEAMPTRGRWGCLLTSTTKESHAEWWRAPEGRPARCSDANGAWAKLATHLRRCSGRSGGRDSVQIVHEASGRPRWLLWAFWPESV